MSLENLGQRRRPEEKGLGIGWVIGWLDNTFARTRRVGLGSQREKNEGSSPNLTHSHSLCHSPRSPRRATTIDTTTTTTTSICWPHFPRAATPYHGGRPANGGSHVQLHAVLGCIWLSIHHLANMQACRRHVMKDISSIPLGVRYARIAKRTSRADERSKKKT